MIFIAGLDEVPTDQLIEMLKHIHEFSIANRSVSIVLSCRTLFYNHDKAGSIIPLFETYELGHYDSFDIATYTKQKLKSHAKAFDDAVSRNNLRGLLYQPFYLII